MRPEPKRKGPMIWTILIGLIMILSVIGFLYVPEDTTESYAGYKIAQASDGYYYVRINDQQVRFTYHPSNVASYEVNRSVMDVLKNSKLVFLTFNPTEEKEFLTGIDLARFELTNDLNSYFSIAGLQATTLNTTSYNLPIVTCANATQTQPVLEFKSGADTRAYTEENCIILEALSGQDFLRLKDRILYGMFDIIG